MLKLRKFFSSRVGIALISAIAGAAVAVLLEFGLRKIFPTPPSIVIIPEGKNISEIDSTKISPSYPPFVYDFQYVTEGKPTSYGLFNLQKTTPQWFYNLIFSNLSRNAISNINLSFKSQKHFKYIFIQPIKCEISLNPSQKIAQDKPTCAAVNTDNFVVLVHNLPPFKSAGVVIVVCNEARPSVSDFIIDLQCNEGIFEKMPLSTLRSLARTINK